MKQEETLKDWNGRIIGYVETDTITGDKILRDFYRKIKGYYKKKLNITTDFYGKRVASGDMLLMLLNK